MSSPNPKATEAGISMVCKQLGGVTPDTIIRERVEQVVQAAEPHIRSSLLTELAEEFERHISRIKQSSYPETFLTRYEAGQVTALATAAGHCRELAAKEESDA